MESAPATIRYNCMAWALGLWDEWHWPQSDVLNGKSEEEQTMYFCDELYDYGYVQCDEESAMIDLWALFDEDGNFKKYTHLSVRNVSVSDKFLHGYDWESKLGSSERIFHTRYSLEGNNYGKVVMHFKPKANVRFKSLYERIADGEIMKDDVVFEQNEIDIIESKIRMIDSRICDEFLIKYSYWYNFATTLPYSDMKEFTYNNQYKDFCDFCIKYPETEYLIFALVERNDILSMQVVEDLIKPKYINIYNKVQEELRLSDAGMSVPVYRSNFAKIKYFIKEMIKSYCGINKSKITSVCDSYENCIYSFNVDVNCRIVSVNIDLAKESKTELLIYSLNGIMKTKFVDNAKLETGRYRFTTNLDTSGTYLIVLKTNGKTEVKKIIID